MKSANDIEEPYDGKLSRTVLKPSRSGDAPAQGNIAQGAYLFDAFLGYRFRFVEVSVSVENLLNQRYKQAQFAITSRLPSEPSQSAPPPPIACPSSTRAKSGSDGNFLGCEDVSFTPGYPINARFTVSLFY